MQRYSCVPWLSTTDDLRQGQMRAWEAEDHDDERRQGWLIADPLSGGDEVLVTHAIRGNGNDGGHITLALNVELADVPVRRSSTRRWYQTYLGGPRSARKQTEEDGA